MTQEETNNQLEALFKKNLDPIREDVAFLKENMATKTSLQELRKFTESSTNDLMEIVVFLKDTAASKEDLKGFATKEDLKVFATETRAEFTDIRYVMADMQTDIKRIDIKIDTTTKSLGDDIAKLSKRTDEDYQALAKDIASLKDGSKKRKALFY